MAALIPLLIALLVILIILGLLYWGLSVLPVPQPLAWLKWAIMFVAILIAIIYLLRFLPGLGS